ncbi:hypothetical protein EPA93_35545 [Ktedonosporobacter rubrisoli]|uniref:Cobalamin-independent methionine synthase MetE N-terminal domain-containing protein n=1 Tax=Ktedonosporobacter rubrisoli TaxID=2509675 RepID=A0A4V0YZV1_KTERU|nr:hypothetical protein [Ktedonosporobacter rubrisoli]QBD81001.1 hypothetical protein EPA93_35545 [Ktedonosporobacter rubrisoli]
MLQATNLGYPPLSWQRGLKKTREQFWSARICEQDLLTRAVTLCKQHWLVQQQPGLQQIPSNDFSL